MGLENHEVPEHGEGLDDMVAKGHGNVFLVDNAFAVEAHCGGPANMASRSGWFWSSMRVMPPMPTEGSCFLFFGSGLH